MTRGKLAFPARRKIAQVAAERFWKDRLPRRPGHRSAYNRVVQPTPLNLDTAPEIESQQIAAWRRMSPQEKAALVTALTRTAYEMAWAGVRHRHPGASAREQFLRVAVIVLGPELAATAYPDAAALGRE